ncbi:MAG: DUF3368 domain-containing protein [Gammaproteobacteria bacterium]|nr:DUF3368 domain-containing protein [Gammaproteobacteria bacterium]
MFKNLAVNASPLIFLRHINGLPWLAELARNGVFVPEAVVAEVQAGDNDGKQVMTDARRQSNYRIVPDLPLPPIIATWDLGAGESQVLAYCYKNTDTAAVLDDLAARNCARALNFRVIGTVGMVLIARQRGWISAARPVFNRLIARKMYLGQKFLENVLKSVGE